MIGAVPVRLLNNDAVYGSVVAFTYRELAQVDRVHPVAGMRFGGTLVTVFGSGFLGDAAAMCRFGPVAVPARLLTLGHPGQLECISPLPAVAGYVSVEVSMNGQDYSSTGVHFEYQQPVSIRALEPSRGPIEGGTFVNVTGSGFSARAALLGYVWCRFNSTSVAVAWRSSTELHCISPRHQAGAVSVELTQNEQQYTRDNVRFEFEVVAAYTIQPNTGPIAGGTRVEILGSGIEVPDARGLYCQFGAMDPVSATHASRERVICVAPPSEAGVIGAVPVRLLNNDAVYGSVVAFTYRELAQVDRVHPVAGMRFGGTLVTVFGSGFLGDAAAMCRFGPVAVPARLLTLGHPGQLECISPLPAVAGYVSVEVSMNGQDYSSTGVHFEYQQPVSIRALEPSRGPIEGGTFVNVTGSGFSPRAALLGYVWCRFNSTSVAVAWRSSTELHCISPRHQAGAVSVELTQNEQQYTRDNVRFEFEVVAAYTIQPNTGPIAAARVWRSSALALRCRTLAVCTANSALWIRSLPRTRAVSA